MTSSTSDTELRELLEANAETIETDDGEYLGADIELLEPLIQAHIEHQRAEARDKAIEDVKKAGYGYDDGTGFVLKISFVELSSLKSDGFKYIKEGVK